MYYDFHKILSGTTVSNIEKKKKKVFKITIKLLIVIILYLIIFDQIYAICKPY